MLRPKIEIQIGNIKFSYITSWEGNSSWEQLTETFKITIPNKAKFKGESIVNNKTETGESLFKRGDAITVKFGYYPSFQTIYTGFLSRIVPGSPLGLECQDAMYKLKQTSHTISFKQQKLSELISTITKDENGAQIVPFEAADTTLGPFRTSNASAAQILEKLRGDPYGFFSYIQGGVLKVGLAYTPGAGTAHKFDFQRNIISSSLEYLREDDVKITIKAVNIDRKNIKTEKYIFFDNEGNVKTSEAAPTGSEVRTLFFYDTPQADIIEAAKRKLPEIIYEGYRGTFTTFGEPFVKHGDIAVLKDRRFPERDGKYLIKGNGHKGSTGGFRQQIELDAKVA